VRPPGKAAAGGCASREILVKKGYRAQKVIDARVGDIRIRVLSDGLFRLDGGAMFGVVPRVLWEKRTPPDPSNRILMGLNPLLIETAGEKILVDTGVGDKFDGKFREMFAIQHRPSLRESLREAGVSPDEITMVVNTHLHFDHAGGNTRRDGSGRLVPAFPSAVYVVQEGEWQDALRPNERNRRSYLEDDFVPLEREGVLRRVRGEVELAEGVRVLPTPGHTRHHQCVLIASGGETAFYAGDLVPMSLHVPYPYIMGYDLFPVETLRQKKEILPRAHREGWLLVFEHDPVTRLGRLRERGEGFEAVPWTPDPEPGAPDAG
jgi:glyoxylase-like metal-dependent hydrolase (beta-lactamase superfamily II)